MTSDAKIGLLLGLVFIFIIAFIINGLPKLRGESDSNELTEIMMKNNPPGIGGWERKADEILSPPPQMAEQGVEPRPASDNSPLTVSGNTDVRYAVPIPGYGSLLRDSSSRQESQYPVGPVRAPEDSLVVPKPAVADATQVAPYTIEPTTTMIIRPVQLPKPAETKTHVVADGETIASIAKKHYGPENGNKRANVTRIFEANRKLLKSPDDIFVGQKIVIPALPVVASAKAPGSGPLSGPLFEPVKSVGQKNPSAGAENKEPGRFYAVKEGDSLWAISADQLGNGIRYKEIAKLNADILPNEDDVRVGLQLKLPAK
ncbi:MAG TPA: LysM peptidoglycan-binding domain-containing protein [Sedimentisphaerales bacterium]|nr:LysM peptidoglycan-binding domain-containing protein [Sedimentisphaerales bacterium]